MKVVFRCDPALEPHLVRPFPARQALPEWLKAMPATAFSDIHGTDVRTVKQCPPFIDAMSHGFMMPLACDVMVKKGELSWDWNLPPPGIGQHPRSPISFHVPAQATGTPFHTADRAIVKFNSFWTIETEPGWSLFATHPANRLDLPFRLITGLVDTDRFSAVGIFFPALWTDSGFDGVLPKGTPVAQCFPVPRGALDLDMQTMTAAQTESYDRVGAEILAKPGVYRKTYRARRGDSPHDKESGD